MAQYLANTSDEDEAQQYNTETDTINNAEPLICTAYQVGKTNYHRKLGFRFQPNIYLTGYEITVNSVYIRMTAQANGGGAGQWLYLYVYDGDCDIDLTMTDITSGPYITYDGKGGVQNAGAWVTDTEYSYGEDPFDVNSVELRYFVKEWFDRAGYASDDWIGIIVYNNITGSDRRCYDGDSATASKRPELEINYTLTPRIPIQAVSDYDALQTIQTGSLVAVQSI